MTGDHAIPRETLARMIRTLDADWALREAVAEERGFTAVYRVTVETGDDRREAVLKASPDGEPHGIDTEARLLSLLADRTSIPVPNVIRAVDDHPELPTPFFLMDVVSGTAQPYRETGRLSDAVLRRLARQTGEYLGELHAIDAVASYGTVTYDRPAPLAGGPPTPALDRLGVSDGAASWPAAVRSMVKRELDGLDGGRFDDLVPGLRTTFEREFAALHNAYHPVLGRIDHGVHNLLIEPETGDIEAVIDWGFTLAVTPGYDLATVEWVLSGAVLSALPDADDRRELVGDALAAGYRSTGDYPADELRTAGPLYELMATVRAMNHLDVGIAKVPEGTEDAVAGWLRLEVETHLG